MAALLFDLPLPPKTEKAADRDSAAFLLKRVERMNTMMCYTLNYSSCFCVCI